MATIADALAVALQHHRAGNLPQAEQLYRQILQAEPGNADALHLLGVLAQQRGRPDLAVSYIGQALAARPEEAAFHLNLGNAYQALGRPGEAQACYRQAVRLRPDLPEGHYALGNALKDGRRLAEAEACYREALRLKPGYVDAHNNLGCVLREQGRPVEAEAGYREALRLDPGYAEGHNNLGLVLQGQGRLAEAEACYREALRFKPGYAEAHNNLGLALHDRGRPGEAEGCYREALRLRPDFPEAHHNLGNALKDQGQPGEAEACYREALRLRPDYAEAYCGLSALFQAQGRPGEAEAGYREALRWKPAYPEAHNNLGAVLQAQGRLAEAEAHYREATRLDPENAEAHYNLGYALRQQGRLDEAVAAYRQAVALRPDYPAALGQLVHELQHVCAWDDLEDLSRRAIKLVETGPLRGLADLLSPFSFLTLATPPTTAAQQLQCARKWVRQWSKTAGRPGPPTGPPRRPGAKVTLGYLSADFAEHATARLVAELFESHDRARFAVFGYSYGRDDGSPMRRRLERAFDRFTDLQDPPFAGAARRIAADGVDILVDLKGYTHGARTAILALRPAPVQVNYLGYPGTMGAPFVDYILVDDFVVPPDRQPFFTEKLVHLPGCYQVNDSRRAISPLTPSRAGCGLPAEGFVFCSFNNSYKITPAVFEVWLGLLRAVPGSVLWLLEGNRFAPVNLRGRAAAAGVAGERLVFAPPLPLPEHLARYRRADLFLDTFPVNAHTTASDALWAGCPVLTIAGETFVSRVAGSLLRSLGLPELVTTSLADYRELALRLARDADLRADLRARLVAGRDKAGLFNGGRFARGLEQAYAAMWEAHLSGAEPRSFVVGPT